jgi:histidine triad (HIT) family protein
MAEACLFCSIIAGTVPATKVFENDEVLAFADIDPQAPTHVLVVPKQHLRDIIELGADPHTAAALIAGIREVAAALGLDQFRTVFNTGAEVGQSVYHVHAHVLSGRAMGWPPG